jgi:hypothetical protein
MTLLWVGLLCMVLGLIVGFVLGFLCGIDPNGS